MSAPFCPFLTSSTSSRGNSFIRLLSINTSPASPCACWEPTSDFFFKSSMLFWRDSILLSFSWSNSLLSASILSLKSCKASCFALSMACFLSVSKFLISLFKIIFSVSAFDTRFFCSWSFWLNSSFHFISSSLICSLKRSSIIFSFSSIFLL